jgi:hypothetical protein
MTTARIALVLAAALTAAGSARAQPPAPPAPAPAAVRGLPQDEVSRDRLLDTLKALPTKRSCNGSDEHRKGLHDTEDLLLDKLRAMGYTPVIHGVDFLGSSRDDRNQADRKPWRNIIVEVPGSLRPEQVLVFSAHFDAVPAAPGADDDGTGTAALLEMARLLKDRPVQRTLRLCFFNLEEVGLVGSRAYVDSIEEEIKGRIIKPADGAPPPADPPANPDREPPAKSFVGMVSMDGIGYYSDAEGSQKSPIPETKLFKPPTVGDFLGVAGILRHRTFSQALDKAMHQAAPGFKTVVVDFLPIALPDLLRSDTRSSSRPASPP